MRAYTPGKQPTEIGWVKLNTNEAPYGPSPRAVEAISKAAGRLGRYPPPTSAPLREALARKHGLSARQVIVGNGSDDLLNLLFRAYSGPDIPAGLISPCYSLYPVLAAAQETPLKTLRFTRDFQLPLEAIAESGVNLFFLTSPNAPTGVGFSTEEIRRLAKAFPGLLVVDEAYAAFAPENAAELVRERENVAVVRTFSKSHALAGLRVGYLLASESVIAMLDRVRDSYNVDLLAQVGALAALEDEAYYAPRIAGVIEAREALAKEFRERGWFVYPSRANFLFAEPRQGEEAPSRELASELFQHLLARRVLVRAFPADALTASFLRFTMGTAEENQLLLEAIDSWMSLPAKPA